MSRIAIISDIHGNQAALESVFLDIDSLGIKKIVFAGDVMGRGPDAERCSQMIIDRGIPGVRGNHEDLMVSINEGKYPKSWTVGEKFKAAFWMHARLSQRSLQWAKSLPFSMEVDGIYFTHAGLKSNRDFPKPWEQYDHDSLFENTDCKIYACGHTHKISYIKTHSGKIVVNSGSVGMPFNGDIRAQYMIVENDRTGLSVTPRFVKYDYKKILQRYHETGFLKENGFYSKLLLLDVYHARPHIASFYIYCSQNNLPEDSSSLLGFLESNNMDDELEVRKRKR